MRRVKFVAHLRSWEPDAWLKVLVLVVLLCGIALFGDFGITWDHTGEHFKWHKGSRTFAFWFGGFHAEDAVYTTGHNPFYFFVYHAIWRAVVGVGIDAPIVETYHLLNFFVATVGVVFVYRLARHLVGGQWALLAALLIVVSPRWFSHAFTNLKDIPFAVAWLACLDTLIRAGKEPSLKNALWHGVALGMLLAARIGGLMFLPVSLAGLILGARAADAPEWRNRLLRGGAAVVLALAIHYLSYPYLILHPIGGMWDLVTGQVAFAWQGSTLTLGAEILSTDVPWWYAPLWLSITIPEVVLLGVGLTIGLGLMARNLPGIPMILTALSAGLPLIYVVLSQSPIYDGPRHLMFLMPIAAIISIRGWQLLHTKLRVHWIVPCGLGIGALLLVVQMSQLHPYQGLYFNSLTGGVQGAQGAFTLDYWGSSSKESAQWLKQNDDGLKRLCVVAELGKSWRVYLPDWIIEDEMTVEKCPEWAHYAYAFSRNRWLQRTQAYADRHPNHWVAVHHIERKGVRVGTIFKNPSPLSGP
jgi:hypothetical protein